MQLGNGYNRGGTSGCLSGATSRNGWQPGAATLRACATRSSIAFRREGGYGAFRREACSLVDHGRRGGNRARSRPVVHGAWRWSRGFRCAGRPKARRVAAPAEVQRAFAAARAGDATVDFGARNCRRRGPSAHNYSPGIERALDGARHAIARRRHVFVSDTHLSIREDRRPPKRLQCIDKRSSADPLDVPQSMASIYARGRASVAAPVGDAGLPHLPAGCRCHDRLLELQVDPSAPKPGRQLLISSWPTARFVTAHRCDVRVHVSISRPRGRTSLPPTGFTP